MSVESMTIALHHSRAKGSARLVLLGIANHDGDGGSWPSMATLSKYAGGLDRRQTQRAVARLVELGEVDVDVQDGGTKDTPDELRPNRYRFLLTCPGDCDRTSQHRTSRQLRLQRGPGRPRGNRAVLAPPGGASTAGGGGASTAGGAVLAPPEPSYEPSREQAQLGASTTEGASTCGQPQPHSCDGGWLHQADDGPAVPCLLCRPHLTKRQRNRPAS